MPRLPPSRRQTCYKGGVYTSRIAFGKLIIYKQIDMGFVVDQWSLLFDAQVSILKAGCNDADASDTFIYYAILMSSWQQQ